MASTYKIFLPNGTSCLLPYEDYYEKLKHVEAALNGWDSYLDGNWISTNHTDVFCGENKVKKFLDGLAYYLLIGSEGVVTDYKEIMNGKREIPMSSCPSQVSDIVYGTGGVFHPQTEEDLAAIEKVMDAPMKSKSDKKKNSQRCENLESLKKLCGDNAHFTYCRVDTQNDFRFDEVLWHIDESLEGYQPKHTPLGDLYDMDLVVAVRSKDGVIHFFDADYLPIPEEKIKKISNTP